MIVTRIPRYDISGLRTFVRINHTWPIIMISVNPRTITDSQNSKLDIGSGPSRTGTCLLVGGDNISPPLLSLPVSFNTELVCPATVSVGDCRFGDIVTVSVRASRSGIICADVTTGKNSAYKRILRIAVTP